MKNRVLAKALLVNHEGHILLLRRSPTDTHRPGEWDYPGGEVEDGEGVTCGAAREIEEEVGLAVPQEELQLVYTSTVISEDINIMRLLYTARVNAATPTLSGEHDHYEWIEPAAALEVFRHPVWNAALQHVLQNGLLPK